MDLKHVIPNIQTLPLPAACPRGACLIAGGEEARCQIARRQAVMHQIGLSTDHYLRKQDPLPASLLAAAALCFMTESSIYELLQNQQLLPHKGVVVWNHAYYCTAYSQIPFWVLVFSISTSLLQYDDGPFESSQMWRSSELFQSLRAFRVFCSATSANLLNNSSEKWCWQMHAQVASEDLMKIKIKEIILWTQMELLEHTFQQVSNDKFIAWLSMHLSFQHSMKASPDAFISPVTQLPSWLWGK